MVWKGWEATIFAARFFVRREETDEINQITPILDAIRPCQGWGNRQHGRASTLSAAHREGTHQTHFSKSRSGAPGIKAKTPEGLNLDHVAQCHAVALVERDLDKEELKSMSAVIENQRHLEDVVEDLLSSVHGVPKKRGPSPLYDTDDIT
jgi:hypothetical protein